MFAKMITKFCLTTYNRRLDNTTRLRELNIKFRQRPQPKPRTFRRTYASSSLKMFAMDRVVDLRSDTVTQPSRLMLEAAMHCQTGDDVMGEDPTVIELESYVSTMFGKQAGLYLPTGTMAKLGRSDGAL